MKKLLLILTFFTMTAHAAYIPPTLFGLGESGYENWTPTDLAVGTPDTEFDLAFTFGNFNSSNAFGMYILDAGGAVAGTLDIFQGAFGTGTSVWDIFNYKVSTQFGTMDLTAALTQPGYELGFFIAEDDKKFYSHSALNGGVDHFGIYVNNDPFGSFDLAVYGVNDGHGFDKDKYIVKVDDARAGGELNPTSVPEPETAAIMAIGLLGLAFARKRKHARSITPAA